MTNLQLHKRARLGPRTVPPSAVFFRDKSPREAFERPWRGQRGADVGDDAAVEGQPAGFTLRSSSRSAMAEVETENVGRVNSCFVAQANAWRQRRRFEVAARHDQEAAPQVGPEHRRHGLQAAGKPLAPFTEQPEAPVSLQGCTGPPRS